MPVPRKITNYIAISFIVLLAMIHGFIGLWWLAGWWFFVLVVFVVSLSKHPLIVALGKKSWLIFPLIFLGVLILAISVRVLVFGVFHIPSSSMERTIIPGDIVWGNKLAYGPALPQSPYEIPWVNLLTWLVEGSRADLNRKWWEPRRLRGYGSPVAGDIIVFEDPANRDVMIKRCMGRPGDTVRLVNGRVYINSRLHEETIKLLLYSRVTASDHGAAINALDSVGVSSDRLYTAHETGQLRLFLTMEEMVKLSRLPGIMSVSIEKERPDTAWSVYPYHDIFSWSIDDYGPIIIPAKGDTITLTRENWILYGRIVNEFENAGINESGGQFLMDGQPITGYTFLNNYYFMLGDNRHDSRDSRYFGLVPEHKIICKATLVLFSRNDKNPGLSRVFKKLR